MGRSGDRDDSGYLRWRVAKVSPRRRWLTKALWCVAWIAVNLPHHLVRSQLVVRGSFIAGVAMACIAFALALSEIHSY
jgi:hypothetical protein